MTSLRIIDLSPFYEGGGPGRASVAAEVDAACRELGFFAVTGHRVDLDLIARTRAAARGFFALPEEAKLAARPAAESTGRGYVPVEGETLSSTTSYEAAPDCKESFSIGPLHVGSEPYYLFEPSGVAFAPNVWPPEPRSFEPTMRQCYAAFGALADDLMTLTALAMGGPEERFAAASDRPTSALRVLHYPPRPRLRRGQYLASPHTDYGTWTILHKRPGPTGLQAQAVSGEWVDIAAPQDGFVVNVGDLLMRWTGGHWLSTLHRVMPAPAADPEGEVSLVFFHQPNWDVVVYPVRTDVADRPELASRYRTGSAERHYFGVPAGEFVFGKYRTSVSVGPAHGSTDA